MRFVGIVAEAMASKLQGRPGFWHRRLLGLDPERAHDIAIRAAAFAGGTGLGRRLVRRRYPVPSGGRLSQEVLGRRFENPLGLAAGFDKNARAVHGMAALGFGFVEVGTVTPRPQAGNPKPRIFRHAEHESLRNALGFNNDGMEAVHRRLAAGYPYPFPIGVNVGKNKATPLADARSDYEALFRRFGSTADYLVINVSSPNTPGLRDLQSPDEIAALLELGAGLSDRPLLVKLSPDLETDEAVGLARAAVDAGAAGIILTNTTIDYSLIPEASPPGGLSGRVLRERSYGLLQAVARELFGEAVLISVGGVSTGEEVYRRLRAGASLVQLYTALVYRGAALVSEILADLVACMERDGHGQLSDIVGADVKRA